MMKTLCFCLITILVPVQLLSQTFEWVSPATLNYQLNPLYPSFPVHYNNLDQSLLNARMVQFSSVYGTSALGRMVVESRDTNGTMLWQFPLGDHANINRIATDASGNVYATGQFQQDLFLGSSDTLNYINQVFINFNIFLLKLNPSGAMVWCKNLSGSFPLYDDIEAMTIDSLQNIYIAATDFFIGSIIKVDPSGVESLVHSIVNAKRIGNISFDHLGGMYISGAAEKGIFVIDTDTFHAPHDYNMFIARINPGGQPAWAFFGFDITFQKPMVIADADGNALFAGMRFDSTSFNGAFIIAPAFSNDFFVIKFTPAGFPQWVLHQPPPGTGLPGTFETGSNLFIGTDSERNLYMGGYHNGAIDWGNGYTSTTGSFQIRKSAIACINTTGSVQWVKLGGGTFNNYIHALSVSNEGSCYFTGSIYDTAYFDLHVIPSVASYNFILGKIRTIPTSVPDFETSHHTKLFPNPASQNINIPFNLLGYSANVYDPIGKLVMQNGKLTQSIINISSFTTGTYVIHFTDGKNHFFEKFTKID